MLFRKIDHEPSNIFQAMQNLDLTILHTLSKTVDYDPQVIIYTLGRANITDVKKLLYIDGYFQSEI